MARLSDAPNFADCLTIGEAAEVLGVSTATLRNWDRSGKLRPRRHPQNGYRIYLHEDLEAVLHSADLSMLTDEAIAPQADWSKMGNPEHFVQFYERDEFVIDAASGYIGSALRAGDCAIVAATAEHTHVLRQKLSAQGIDMLEAEASGRLVVVDADECLATFTVNGAVDESRFRNTIGQLLAALEQNKQKIYAFGEMVAILWAEGNHAAAITVEQLWNDLAKLHRFSLFCAYPISVFGGDDQCAEFSNLCACHTRVIPAESYAAVDTEEKRLRAISSLQQKARSLEAEVEKRRVLEKALSKRDRERDEFLAALAHELRNPLAPISNALELLSSAGADRVSIATATNVIRRQTQQLTRLVDDLLDIGRITHDKIELRRHDVDLASIIKSAIDASRPEINSAGQLLDVETPEISLRLSGDPTRLAQVFSTLLNNATKFTQAGGRIRIEAKAVGRTAEVSVCDNGAGIASEELSHVFDMFRPVDGIGERSRNSLGIGLTLVRRLVELHGGHVQARSEGLGKGSEFTVSLPLADPKRRSSKTLQSASVPSIARRRVLVVDDNKDSCDTLCILLRHKGHEVWTARDGLEAVLKAGELLPEIILMDVGMPKLNGYEATRRIRETDAGRDMFIVALTGWGTPSDVAKSLEAGCSGHLVKPVDFAELDRLLANAPTGG